MHPDCHKPHMLFIVYDNIPTDKLHAHEVAEFLVDFRGYNLGEKTVEYEEYGIVHLLAEKTSKQMLTDYHFAKKHCKPKNIINIQSHATAKAFAMVNSTSRMVQATQHYIDKETYAVKVLSEALVGTDELIVRSVLKTALEKHQATLDAGLRRLKVIQSYLDNDVKYYQHLLRQPEKDH